MASYCRVEDVKAASNRWKDLGVDAVNRLTPTIERASAFVDERCSSFFDRRTLSITTEPLTAQQSRLFMPAPVIALSSVIEGGVDITANVLLYRTWLEKNAASAQSLIFPGDQSGGLSYWLKAQQSVVIEGDFGFNKTPGDIVQATAHISGLMLGWIEKSFISGDGIAQSIRDLKLPEWVEKILNAHEIPPYDASIMRITEL